MSKTTAISACPLDCFGVCSFKVTAEDNRVVSIEPNTDNPVTGNLICSKGRDHVARINHPNRVLEPMRKTADGWEPISWDTAMDFLEDKIRTCLSTYGHHSIASFVGGGAAGKLKGVTELFFKHLGGGTVFSGGLCWSAGTKAQKLDFGKVLSHSPEDLLNARSLILWGKNPADTHFHLLPWITKARKAGCRVILVDPVTSASSSYSDHVIRPLPGTDWALAAAVLQVILEKGLGNSEALRSVETQDPELLKAICSLSQEQLLAHCGISSEEMLLLADAYGFSTPCSTRVGYGIQRYETGGSTIRLMDLLAYISGQVGIPGGGISYANQANSDLFDWSWAEPTAPVDEREFQQGNMGLDLLNSDAPPVKLFFVACGNPAVQVTDTRAMEKALKAVETVVVIDHFMTDTAQLADLVLPATFFLENEDVITSGMWNSLIHYTPQIVSPRGKARSELHIFSELAGRLQLLDFPQLNEAQWLERLVRPLKEKGITLEQMKEKGWVHSPNQQDIPWKDHVFHTENMKFNPIPTQSFVDLAKKLDAVPEAETLPFISVHIRNSINSQQTMDTEKKLPDVYLHPDTAEHYGIQNGDRLNLSNSCGSIEAIAAVVTTIRPGVAACKQGAWKYNGQCINDLSPSGVSDIGGQALMNDGRVRITKC